MPALWGAAITIVQSINPVTVIDFTIGGGDLMPRLQSWLRQCVTKHAIKGGLPMTMMFALRSVPAATQSIAIGAASNESEASRRARAERRPQRKPRASIIRASA